MSYVVLLYLLISISPCLQVQGVKTFNLLVSSHQNQVLLMEFTDEDSNNALTIMKKIEAFCDKYEDALYEEVITSTVTYCIDYVRRKYCLLFQDQNPSYLSSVPELMSPGQLGAAATLYFMGGYEMRQGAHDFLYFDDVSWPRKISDLSYTWRASVAILVPIHCTPGMRIEDLVIMNLLLPSFRDSLRDETKFWVDISLYISMENKCTLSTGEVLTTIMIERILSQMSIPFKNIYAAEYESSRSTSDAQQYDFLLEMAYSNGCDYYFIFQEHLSISTTNWLFNAISAMIRSDVLPWDTPFGCTFLHTNRACSDGSGRTCATGLVLSRSHVAIFRKIGAFSLSLRDDDTPLSLHLTVAKIMDVYRSFPDSVGDFAMFDDINDTTYPSPTQYSGMSPFLNQDYPLDVFYLRHQVANWLHANSPFSPSLKFSDHSLLYGSTDSFYNLFTAKGFTLNGIQAEDTNYQFKQKSAVEIEGAKVAVLTAVFGGYEVKLHRFAQQTVPTDFICFTDMGDEVNARGWIIDRTPYHLDATLPTIDTGEYVNSIKNNKHPMNIGKFYKQFFFVIPRMKKYDHVIWIDGSLVLEKPDMVFMLQSLFKNGKNLVLFEHWRNGKLENEAKIAASSDKYNSTIFNGIPQPLQDISRQYEAYLWAGYDEYYWHRKRPDRPQYGVWITCFIAYDMTNPESQLFLTNWYLQTLMFSTQDQVGFSFAAQMTGVLPYSLPDRLNVNGTALLNNLYRKQEHGK